MLLLCHICRTPGNQPNSPPIWTQFSVIMRPWASRHLPFLAERSTMVQFLSVSSSTRSAWRITIRRAWRCRGSGTRCRSKRLQIGWVCVDHRVSIADGQISNIYVSQLVKRWSLRLWPASSWYSHYRWSPTVTGQPRCLKHLPRVV